MNGMLVKDCPCGFFGTKPFIELGGNTCPGRQAESCVYCELRPPLFLFLNTWHPSVTWDNPSLHPSTPWWCQRAVFQASFRVPCQRCWVPCCVNEFWWIHCALVSAPCSRIGWFWWPFIEFEGASDWAVCVGQGCLLAQCPVTDLPAHRTPPVFWPSRGLRAHWAIHRVV